MSQYANGKIEIFQIQNAVGAKFDLNVATP